MAETKKKTTKKTTASKPVKKTTTTSTSASTTSTSTNSTSTKKSWSSTKVLDFVSYFAIIFIAIAVILRLIFQCIHIDDGSLANTFQSIGECMAYIICIWLGFYWTLRKCRNGINKHNVWWLIGWVVATVVIVVVYIVTLLNL